jgi:hypothetical protein
MHNLGVPLLISNKSALKTIPHQCQFQGYGACHFLYGTINLGGSMRLSSLNLLKAG